MSAEPVEPNELARLLALNSQRPLTVHDLPAEDPRFGLIDGELFVVPPMADMAHQELAGDLTSELKLRAREAGLPSEVRILPGGNVIENDKTILMPDVMVVDRTFLVHNGLGVAPQGLLLAIEISSPSTRRHDLVDKRELYERWGVPFIFVDRKPTPWQVRVFGELPKWAEELLPSTLPSGSFRI
jgi:Uma2 family endonuclease